MRLGTSMKKALSIVTILTLVLVGCASGPENQTASECTTKTGIQYEFTEKAPPELNSAQVREAVMASIGKAGNRPPWAKHEFAGDWYYEYDDDAVIYSGFVVRSHYLRVAIILSAEEVRTIVCDSRELGQSRWAIHRNVPIWKATLDDNIRVAMRQAAQFYSEPSSDNPDDTSTSQLYHLDALYHSGALTMSEYQEIKQRVVNE